MATEQNDNNYTKPLVFDGEDFDYWKDRLERRRRHDSPFTDRRRTPRSSAKVVCQVEIVQAQADP